ncbi:MAG: hypothetical protein ABEH35_08830 [Haloarculaceae archaeon]
MGLDVDPPEPPSLDTTRNAEEYDDVSVSGDEYRRDELEQFLEDGAWVEAFEEWAADTDLTAEQFAVIRDLGLIAEYDFFWDDFAGRVGYHAPGLPEDWNERDLHPDIDSWGTVSAINAALTELGQVVSEVLKDEYVDWEADFEPPEELGEFE